MKRTKWKFYGISHLCQFAPEKAIITRGSIRFNVFIDHSCGGGRAGANRTTKNAGRRALQRGGPGARDGTSQGALRFAWLSMQRVLKNSRNVSGLLMNSSPRGGGRPESNHLSTAIMASTSGSASRSTSTTTASCSMSARYGSAVSRCSGQPCKFIPRSIR